MSLFGFDLSKSPHGGRLILKRDPGGHESWVDTILSADAEAGQLPTETNRRPLLAMALTGALMLAVMGLRLFDLQIVGGSHNLALAESNGIRQTVIRATRGIIYDSNHQPLVSNQAGFDVTVVPAELPKTTDGRRSVYQKLSSLIGLSAAQIQTAAESQGLNQIQPQLVTANLPREQALLLDQNSYAFPGFALDVNPTRQYSDSNLSHVLGYTGRVSQSDLAIDPSYSPTDYAGKNGIEKQYENFLRGINGSQQTEVNAAGQPIQTLASKAPQAGDNLILNIDKDLEDHLAANLQQQITAAGAQRGAAVALDPRNGDVLALVSLPSYDSNLFSRGISQSDYSQLVNNPGQPLFDKAVSGAYPSGSTIKPLVAASALQEHVITTSTTIVDQGKLEVPNPYNPGVTYTYYGWEHTGLGVMNVYRAIAMSSDIFFYEVGGGFESFIGLGIQRLDSYYQKFGIGQKTGIDLPGEGAGRLPTPDWKQKVMGQPWYTGDTYNISVGQGDILVSPLQMAVATAAIANGGTIYQPHVLKQVLDSTGKTVKVVEPQAERKLPIDSQNLAIVRDAMRQTVASGTACCFFDQQVPVPVAGKTGTAETDPAANALPDAWFTSFAPYNNPQIVVVAMIEHAGEGAQFAVPVVRQTLAWCFTRPGGCVK